MVSTTDECVGEVAAVDVPNTEMRIITEEEFEKAQKTFQLGKKNLFLNKYDEAVNNIGEACKIYSEKFGELDAQCADIYFFYGRSLLELARVENTVLGNALTGVPEETEPIDDSRYGNPEDVNADEKEEIAEKVMDALCGTDEEEAKPTEEKATNEIASDTPSEAPGETKDETPGETKGETKGETTDETKGETTGETKGETTGETSAEAKPESESIEEKKEEEKMIEEAEGEGEEEEEECDEDLTKNDGENKDEENEDISNLQRSWEMFELAKLVYSKNYDNDLIFKNKRIAECLLKLGEISIEQESYEQALTDIGESIRLQEEQTGEQRDERMLAESYYQFGLAQQFNNQFNEANESYKKSINIVQLRIEKLRGKLSQIAEGADGDLERTTINDEITELETLLPEMSAKLEEVNEQGKESLNLIKEAKECFMNSMENKLGQQASIDGEVKDITSLVKSKRKMSSSDETGIKKTRLSGTNDELAPEMTDENKPAEMETETNKENVPAAEPTETPNDKIAIDEPAPTAEEQTA